MSTNNIAAILVVLFFAGSIALHRRSFNWLGVILIGGFIAAVAFIYRYLGGV